MTPGRLRGRERTRRAFRRKLVVACAAALVLAAACFLGSRQMMKFLGAKSEEKFIRGGSGGRYTPAEAAKRAVEKIRGK